MTLREFKNRGMKKLILEEILSKKIQDRYEVQYQYVLHLIEEGIIKPVKSSPKNGKKPSLHTMYWVTEEKPDYGAEEEELLYHTDTRIKPDYYLRHPDVYVQERAYVRRLNSFLQNNSDSLNAPVSRNERSFAIWGEEKFLSGGSGRTILSHCGIEEELLNCYSTAEPFAYYAAHRDTPQKILIIENKDPFFGMRKHLLAGNEKILGVPVRTLIYGAGKRVVSSFKEFVISAEPYMKEKGNEFLYFGDLDYEGIGIYERLVRNVGGSFEIRPFIPAYQAMLDKCRDISLLPPTKEKQNRNISDMFLSYFNADTAARMKCILEKDLYIPQEILNITDY